MHNEVGGGGGGGGGRISSSSSSKCEVEPVQAIKAYNGSRRISAKCLDVTTYGGERSLGAVRFILRE